MQILKTFSFTLLLAPLLSLSQDSARHNGQGNPVFAGWYADPEAAIFKGRYWIFPTYSDKYEKQVFFDAFSSKDLVTWTRHPHVLDTAAVKWAKKAMWAPAAIEKEGRYYLFFSANDVHPGEVGGIGVAIAASPEGPYKDLIGKPLVGELHHGAQPIDQFVFRDSDGSYYLLYGGWGHCNLAKLQPDFKGFENMPGDSVFKEITPTGYVEGPMMFIRNGRYYFMWSEGGWGLPNYRVSYAIGNSVTGPFKKIGTVLSQDSSVATGAGHHSVINIPGTDEWYIVYHRRPLGLKAANQRVVCIDRMEFDEEGFIKPVKISFAGPPKRKLKKRK